MATYKLHLGTQAEFDAKLAAGTLVESDLYFIEDTQLIYKGSKLMSAAVEAVESFPSTGAQGRIYVNSDTLEAKVWNGSEWTVVSPAVELTLDENTAAGALVTASAIRAYVEAQTGTAGLVQDVAYDATTQKITVTYADSTSAEIALKNLVTDVAYDGATGDFTFSMANGEAKVVNTPVENFLSTASYDEETHILTMTLTDGTTVTADLGDLIDTYVGGDTATASVDVTGNTITADVKISAAEGNIITANEDGLFAAVTDLSNFYNKGEVDGLLAEKADADTVYTKDEADALLADKADATAVYTKEEADAALALKADADKVYTKEEADAALALKADATAVYTKEEADALLADKANVADVYAKTETYTQAEVDAAIAEAIEASHTWEAI